MSKILLIKSLLLFVIMTLALFLMISSNHFSNVHDHNSLSALLQIPNANAECDKPEWLFGNCNQRVESIQSECERIEIHRTYYDSNNQVCGTAILSGGIFEIISGYSTGQFSDVTVTETYTATRVNCPTDGSDNDCEEYDPC